MKTEEQEKTEKETRDGFEAILCQQAHYFDGVEQSTSIDFMLRNTQNHLVQLSIMADQKANILIGATLLVQTILISVSSDGVIRWELLVLSFFSFWSTLFAVLALFPALGKIKTSEYSRNMLFFAHFTGLSQDDYLHQMSTILKNPSEVYSATCKDIYQLDFFLKTQKFK